MHDPIRQRLRRSKRRRALARAAATTALLSLMLWIASLWGITWRSTGRNAVTLWDGVLSVHNHGTYTPDGWSALGAWYQTPRPFVLSWWPQRGMWDFYGSGTGQRYFAISVPLWLPTLCMLGAWGLLYRRGSVSGACIHCGYDLRSTVERCPECGASPNHSDQAIQRREADVPVRT